MCVHVLGYVTSGRIRPLQVLQVNTTPVGGEAQEEGEEQEEGAGRATPRGTRRGAWHPVGSITRHTTGTPH